MTFFQRLTEVMTVRNSLLCLGLDPVAEAVDGLGFGTDFYSFNKTVIDVCADQVCAFKPQVAHYSALGKEADLVRTIEYIHERHPQLPVILDAKRGDIGSTAERYAKEVFERYGADAVTLSPYLGMDTFEPFLRYPDKGVIGLVKTSNPGATDIQELRLQDGRPLFLAVAEKLAGLGPSVGFVVGATYPSDMHELRRRFPERCFLVPGIGAQGGTVEQTIDAGADSQGMGLVINVTRGILFGERLPKNRNDYLLEVADLARSFRDQINKARQLALSKD